jgi:hypothetical protein
MVCDSARVEALLQDDDENLKVRTRGMSRALRLLHNIDMNL